jgi:hypothetical protein
MNVTEVDIGGMPLPLTQKRRFRALAGLIARQKITLHLPEIKELSNDEKWDLFQSTVPGRHEIAGNQAFLEDGSQGMDTIQTLA